ncbi:MAG TPA: sugar ABC transporter ATP-binding protein [Cellulomonadaceae bacterium]|nr:sugar ABC transporter ATP-binding protein [Cellulomonadaceae bacterium]
MRGISKRFGATQALEGVSFTLSPGEIHGLVGENGAGKSTLVKILAGVQAPDTGSIILDGVATHIASPAAARALGLAVVHQEPRLFPDLSVAENVFLADPPGGRLGTISWGSMRRKAAELFEQLGVRIDVGATVRGLSMADQQLIEIAKALSVDAKVLILDEPTSSLDAGEVQQLFTVMRSLRDRGVAILFVSHFLEQVYEISDRMTVLRNGQLVGEYLTSALPRLDLISKMIGTSLAVLEELEVAPKQSVAALAHTAPYLQAIGLGRRGAIEPFDLDLYAGEVVGLAGLLGSGRTELARLLTGADRPDHGQTRMGDAVVHLRTPRSALDRKIAYSSEDRKAEGIVADLTMSENILLGLQAERGWTRRIPARRADEIVQQYIAALDIRPPNPDIPARNLSGGNQQKVLLARWLATAPKLLVLDEPTRGIDVGTKAEIQRLVTELARDGMSVVFISSELEEVLRVSHRVAVLRDHHKIAEIESSGVGVDDIVELIASGGRAS